MTGAYMRPRFLKYATTNLTHLRMFLAETAQADYLTHEKPEFHNFAEFEEIIAEISTCVILFPESPGSFAELGYFARHDGLRQKLLVVNDAALQSQDSFIALGPIKLVDEHSQFQPTIQLVFSHHPDFDLIRERLDKRISTSRRKRFNYRGYGTLATQHKFYSAFEILRIFPGLTEEGVRYAARSCWGNVNQKELRRLLSILIAAGYVERGGVEKDHFLVRPDAKPFLEFEGLDENSIKMQFVDLCARSYPDAFDIVRGNRVAS